MARLPRRKVFRAGLELEFHRFARFINLFIGLAVYFDLFKPVFDLKLRVTNAKGRFAEVFASRPERLFNPWRDHRHGNIKSGQIIGQNRDLDQFGAVFKRLTQWSSTP